MSLSSFIADDEGATMVSESISKYGALSDAETELLRLFGKIKSKKLKNGLLIMIKGIVELSENKGVKKETKS